MECFLINGGNLQYDDDTHTYWFNGEKCISVTSILKKFFPRKYAGIEDSVLKKAATRGTAIHNAIEVYESYGLDNAEVKELRNYKFLKKYYMLKNTAVELPIVIKYKNLVVCGRLDGILEEPENGTCLYDIKTTSELDMKYLAMQESLYAYGVKQCYPMYDIKGLRAFHLKNDTRKYVIVDTMDAEELLEDYLKIIEEEKNENKVD